MIKIENIITIILVIVFNYLMCYTTIYFLNYFIGGFTKSQILDFCNISVILQIIIYETFNEIKNFYGWLFGILLALLFMFTYFKNMNLDFHKHSYLMIIFCYEFIMSLYYLITKKQVPNYKLLKF